MNSHQVSAVPEVYRIDFLLEALFGHSINGGAVIIWFRGVQVVQTPPPHPPIPGSAPVTPCACAAEVESSVAQQDHILTIFPCSPTVTALRLSYETPGEDQKITASKKKITAEDHSKQVEDHSRRSQQASRISQQARMKSNHTSRPQHARRQLLKLWPVI